MRYDVLSVLLPVYLNAITADLPAETGRFTFPALIKVWSGSLCFASTAVTGVQVAVEMLLPV